MQRYQLFVKWRLITPPEEETANGGHVPDGPPEDTAEDEYHPDKVIFVGEPFNSPKARWRMPLPKVGRGRIAKFVRLVRAHNSYSHRREQAVRKLRPIESDC